ncbi:OpgC domain-containing protein [Bradyrhizobium erythrophlei]|uniref:OpgC domain-containing protein n=1 Tax=Bradyrhizobium erythrophlei TaxID=1437360 RepID=UPI0035E4D420
MQARAGLPFSGRDVRLDLFRGLANWAIFLDHIPHEALSWITIRNYGFSDAADLFVFISGYTAALVFARLMVERGYTPAALRLAKRALKLYAAHIVVVVTYIALVASVSREFHDPDDLNQFNVALFMSAPFREFIQALALIYKPVNLDVLPLYVLLLGTFAPALWLMVRNANLTLAGSVVVYLGARHFGWNLPAAPTGLWYFNPFAWQLLFFLGAWSALGGARALHPLVRTRAAFWLAIAYLVFALVVTIAICAPDFGGHFPHWLLEPFDPNDKTNLAPYRVVHFVALAVVVVRFTPADSPILKWRALAPLIKCGQSSLQVFCVGILLSFCAHAAIELSRDSLWVQFLVGGAGILLMTAVAYCWTSSRQRDPVLASPVRIGELA